MDYCNKINSAFVNGLLWGGIPIKALILEVVPKILLNWLTKTEILKKCPATLPTGKFSFLPSTLPMIVRVP